MNGGICGAIIALNTVYVLILAYFMFGEALNKLKFMAIILLISSVVLVSLFPAVDAGTILDSAPEVAATGTDASIVKFLTQDDLLNYQIQMIAGGLGASFGFGS